MPHNPAQNHRRQGQPVALPPPVDCLEQRMELLELAAPVTVAIIGGDVLGWWHGGCHGVVLARSGNPAKRRRANTPTLGQHESVARCAIRRAFPPPLAVRQQQSVIGLARSCPLLCPSHFPARDGLKGGNVGLDGGGVAGEVGAPPFGAFFGGWDGGCGHGCWVLLIALFSLRFHAAVTSAQPSKSRLRPAPSKFIPAGHRQHSIHHSACSPSSPYFS